MSQIAHSVAFAPVATRRVTLIAGVLPVARKRPPTTAARDVKPQRLLCVVMRDRKGR
jgi:hypothetical protein